MEVYDISFPDEDITGGTGTYPRRGRFDGSAAPACLAGTVITAIPSGGGIGTYAVNISQLSYPSSIDGPETGESHRQATVFRHFSGWTLCCLLCGRLQTY